MLHRVALSMVLIGGLIFGCSEPSSFSFDDSLRPAAAGTGEVVAKVLVFSGRVQIQAANGFRFDARPEQPLLASDTVAVPEDGFAILQLVNDHLTRLGADVRLKLADSAALSLPQAQHSVQQQLTRVLTPAERSRTERIVGWHARMSAAEGVAVQSEEQVHAHKAMRDFAAPIDEREEDASEATADGVRQELAPAPRPSTPAADQVAAPPREAKKGRAATKSKAAVRPKLKEKRLSGLRKAPPAPSRPAPQPAAKPASSPPPPPPPKSASGGSKAGAPGGARGAGSDLDDLLQAASGDDGVGRRDAMTGKDSTGSVEGRGLARERSGDRVATKKAEASADRVQLVSWRRQGVRVKKGPVPARLRWLVRQVALTECLMAISPKPKPGQMTRLMVWVKGGRLVKFVVPGRPEASGCIGKSFVGKSASKDMPDGVYTLVVRFK